MKTSIILAIVAIALLSACNRPSMGSESATGVVEKELKLADFAPCTVCESEGKLVNPLPDDWSDAEKEMYNVAIDFWEQTTGFLFTSEMVSLYANEGPSACHERFIKVISGELESNGNPVAMEDDIRWFGWRNRFDKSAISQMKISEPCAEKVPEPTMKSDKARDEWEKKVFKCIDIVFDAGVPVCFFVERPILHDPKTAIVRFRLYDSVDPSGNLSFASAYCFYFDKVDEEWVFTMRRDH